MITKIVWIIQVVLVILVMAAILLAGRVGYKAGYQQALDDTAYQQDCQRRASTK